MGRTYDGATAPIGGTAEGSVRRWRTIGGGAGATVCSRMWLDIVLPIRTDLFLVLSIKATRGQTFAVLYRSCSGHASR